jgi:peptidoglycan/LPS O-acetylase OafA/YrhL
MTKFAENSFLPAWLAATLEYGGFGVQLFLVISGFCIHLPWARALDANARIDVFAFWKRRLRRLYPPYFLTLVGCVGALFLFFSVLHRSSNGTLGSRFGYATTSLLVLDLIALIFLFQNVNNASLRIGNGPFWSLALEEQLYILYFPLLALRKAFGWAVTLTFVSVVGVILHAAAYKWSSALGFSWLSLGPSLWLLWTLGAIAVEAHFGHVALPRVLYSPIVAFAFIGLAVASGPRPSWGYSVPGGSSFSLLFFGLAFFVWINAACRHEASETRPRSVVRRALAGVGVCSYSLYLTHYPCYTVAKQIAMRAGAPPIAILLLRIGVAVVVGYAFHILVERRAIAWAHRTSKSPILPGFFVAPAEMGQPTIPRVPARLARPVRVAWVRGGGTLAVFGLVALFVFIGGRPRQLIHSIFPRASETLPVPALARANVPDPESPGPLSIVPTGDRLEVLRSDAVPVWGHLFPAHIPWTAQRLDSGFVDSTRGFSSSMTKLRPSAELRLDQSFLDQLRHRLSSTAP